MSAPNTLSIVPPPLETTAIITSTTTTPAEPISTTTPPTCSSSRPSSADSAITQPEPAPQDSPAATASVFSAAESTATDATALHTPNICMPPPFWTTPTTTGPTTTSSVHSSPQRNGAPRSSNETILRRHGGGNGALVARAGGGEFMEDDDYGPDALPAIVMHDNETDDLDGRGEACWAKSVRITGWTVVEGSVGNIGAFVVWAIRVDTQKGAPMEIHKRYSEFDSFRGRLLKTFPRSSASVPALPPKTMMARFDQKFLEKRRAGLQHFLNCILLNPEFSASPIMREFLFS